MDHFERELSRMMRDTQEHAPFEPRHRQRLRSGVRSRRRARVAQRAVGCALAVAGLGIGFFLLPRDPVENRPQAPLPRPVTSPAAPTTTPTRTPDAPPSRSSAAPPPTATADPTVGGTVGPSETPTMPGNATRPPSGASTSSTAAPPPTSDSAATHTPSAPTTMPSNNDPSATWGSADTG
ncbi:hypothetical protein ABZ027_38435 [Streptomyces sp. NPDC006332]|uniref:hypothetical protein n=1 Tax=Streptomyces sp. NPDC006332 TaxID=3155456 RepID=UPI00339F3ACE